MKKYIFSLFLVFIFCLTAFSQVPGFLGKRFSINVSTHVNPVLWGSDIDNVNNQNQEDVGIIINRRFSVGAEYVLGRKWSVSSYVHIQNTATRDIGFDDDIEEKLNKKLGYAIESNGFSLQFTRFNTSKSDFIAPVGRYFSFGIMVSNFSLIDVKGNSFNPNTKISSGSVSGITFGFGRKRVLYQRFIVDYGIELAGLFYAAPLERGGALNDLITTPRTKIKQISAFNFKLGVGYLF